MLHQDGSWTNLILELIPSPKTKELLTYILGSNLHKTDIHQFININRNPFWGEIWQKWTEYNFKKSEEINTLEEILQQHLWFNSTLKVNNQPNFNRRLYEAGITKIENLVEGGRWANHTTLNNTYNTNINFMELMSMLHCITKSWKNTINSVKQSNLYEYKTKLTQIIKCKKATQLICGHLVKEKCIIPVYRLENWVKDLDIDLDGEDWLDNLISIYKASTSTQIRSFDYKFQMRDVMTNTKLFKMGKSNTRICYLCKSHNETIIHLYWDCHSNKRLWERLKRTLRKARIKTPSNPTFYLLGLSENAEPIQPIAHLLCTLTKNTYTGVNA